MKAEQMTIKYMEWLRGPGHLDKTNVDGKNVDKKNLLNKAIKDFSRIIGLK